MGFWPLFSLYLIGFVFILVDIFTPGLIMASFGAVLIAIGVTVTYYQHGAAWGTTALVSSFLAATTMVVVGYQLLSRTRLGNRTFLDPAQSGSREAKPPPVAALVGKQGVTVTDLRPAGQVQVGGQPHDALTTGHFIPAGRKVAVVATQMNSLVVEEV